MTQKRAKVSGSSTPFWLFLFYDVLKKSLSEIFGISLEGSHFTSIE